MRTESAASATTITSAPSAAPHRRLRRLSLTAGTLVAAWVAAGAPIRLGMLTELAEGFLP